MTEFQRQVDEAVAGLRGYEVSAEDRAAIGARFGETAVRETVRVYSEAMQPPEGWGEGDTMRNGIDAMHARLRERYPWLGEAARGALETMFWKVWR